MQVAVQASSAQGREKTALESRANKSKSKLVAAKEKADAVERAPMPKIEVRGQLAERPVGRQADCMCSYKMYYSKSCERQGPA